MKRRRIDPAWQASVDANRAGVMSALRAIREGIVDAEEVDRLQNFCLFALALMQMEGPQKWALAKLNAEIMSLQHADRLGGE